MTKQNTLSRIINYLPFVEDFFLVGLATGIFIYWVCMINSSASYEDFSGIWKDSIKQIISKTPYEKQYIELSKYGSKHDQWKFIKKHITNAQILF